MNKAGLSSLEQRIKEALAQRERQVIVDEGLTPAAVLLPIYQKEGQYHILFTRRTEKVEYHKGQVSFPGGAYAPGDDDLVATALRETFEEIGLRAEDADILGGLDDMATVISDFVISPFVAAIPYPYQFETNRDEVEELIEVPISALLAPESLEQRLEVREGKAYPVYYYHYQGSVIWGATARILKQFLDLVFAENNKKGGSQDGHRVR